MFSSFRVIGALLFSAVLAACQTVPSTSEEGRPVAWVDLQTDRGETVKALFAKPQAAGKRPAVIFNHGTAVRQSGYEGAASQGNDTRDYVDAIVAAGYVALAPIREFNRSTARFERGGTVGSAEAWDAVIEGGIRTVLAARAYLAKHPDVDAGRIAVIGFSEGGNVTLWSLMENGGFAAAVLMSPATIDIASRFTLRAAAADSRLRSLPMPVFLTIGKQDLRPVKKVASRVLAPRLEQSNDGFLFEAAYPGDHKWFHKVRDSHWADVRRFLDRHLK